MRTASPTAADGPAARRLPGPPVGVAAWSPRLVLRLGPLLAGGVLVWLGRGVCLICQRCAYLVPFDTIPDPDAAPAQAAVPQSRD